MAKMRVHELAKELGKQNKEIMEILNQKGVGVTSHMSALEDKQIEIVKKTVTGEEKPNMENRPSETPKNNEGEAPKKKNISQVFHPQNSRTGMGRPGQRGPRPGQRSQNGERRPAQGGERSGAASASQDERRPQGQGGERRPASGERRPQGQGGERRPSSGERRPQGQGGERRPSSGERRPQGQGGERRPASGERRVQGQGGERRGQGGDRRGNQRGGQSIPKPPMESQPLTKETRNRNERSDTVSYTHLTLPTIA